MQQEDLGRRPEGLGAVLVVDPEAAGAAEEAVREVAEGHSVEQQPAVNATV